MERLTIKAQEALQSAQQIAHQHSHQEIDGEHLLSALLQQSDGLISSLLEKLGAPAQRISSDIDKELARRVKVQGASSADVFISSALKKVFDSAEKEAAKLKDEYISVEHLFLGLLDEGGAALKKIFQAAGLKRDAVLQALADLRGNQRVTDQNPEDKFQALDKYGRDLTALARL